MLSYQHAYHAGNPADLHKHIVLAELLHLLTQKPRGITVMETHAGRGIYDIGSVEAQKTREAADGIAKLSVPEETVFGAALNDIRATHGPNAYPGSPILTSALLRAADRHILMELHPAEHAALRGAMAAHRTEIHQRDGYEGVMAIAPPTPRKGLVLIDPSYEIKSEYDQVADFVPQLLQKWAEASVLVWYPVLSAGRHVALIDRLSRLPHLHREVRFDLKDGKGMAGSGLVLINPPYGATACFDAAIGQAQPVLRPA